MQLQSERVGECWYSPLLVNRWCWRLSSIAIVGSRWFSCGTVTPETGWAQQEQEQSQHRPSHQNHGEGQLTSSADWPSGTWQFLRAVCVCAVGLRLPEQIDEASHSVLMGADALTRVEAPLCHFSPDCVHPGHDQKYCKQLGSHELVRET